MPKMVKVAMLGSEVTEVYVEDSATLDDALEAAGVDKAGCTVRLNGRTPCGGPLSNNDVITLAPEVKGGRR